MPDKCLDCPAPSADMDGFIVSGPGGAPRSEGSGVSSPEGPFAREAPQTGHVVIMGTLGADGNPGTLPDAPQVGWAYVAEDAGTYGGVQATEGDMVYCMSLNPVKWGVLQADSDDSGRDLVSVSASFGCDPSPALSLTSAKASGASSTQTVDMSCLNGRYGALESLSASFECREEPVQLPLCFWADLCEYWDDGESDGCYTEDHINDSVNFSLISGVETKIATLKTVPDTSDLYYVFMLEIGDVVNASRSARCNDRMDSSIDNLYYCVVRKNCGSQFIQVGESQNITFNTLNRVYRVDGDSYRHRSTTSVSSATVTVDSELFGQYTVSARMVREPDGPNGEYVISVYATAVSAESGSGATPVLSLTSTGADGTSSTQEVDMSCLVPPVFDGSADGLVPASGAAQNLLLHGDASWSTLVPDPASESSNEAAPVHYVADMLRREVEAYTMGRNTIVRDQWNNPHVMLVVPRFLLSDIDASWPAVSHPAFVVGGQVRSEFLIGKYEAAQSAAGRVLTLPGKAPWVSVNFDAALAACRALGPGFCLQTRAMWSARQLWVHKLNGDGHAYLGNTNWGRSHARPWQTGVMQTAAFNPGDTGNTGSAATLTGSGGPFWNDDGTESGLADVTGNVSEWVAGLRVLDGEIQIVQDGDACLHTCDMSASSSAWKAVLPDGSLAVPGASGTLKFDGSVPDTRPNWSSAGAARLNAALVNQNVNGYYSNSFASLSAVEGVDVPALLVQLGLMPFSSGVQGIFWVCNKGERLPHAGGHWPGGSNGGPWYLHLGHARSYSYRYVGFRPAFVS